MKDFALRAAVTIVRVMSALAELFTKRRDTILLISCQDDEPTQDMAELADALRALPDAPDVVVQAGLMRRSFAGALSFAGKLFSMMRNIAAAKTVVIDAYCPAISIPKKRGRRKIVQMWHAPDAIKKFSMQIIDTPAGYSGKTAMILNMHQGYDYILCPADATRPFFAEAFGYPESAFVKYGLPMIDRAGKMRRPGGGRAETEERTRARTAIALRYPQLDGRLAIVYAPTFRDGAGVDAAGLAEALRQASEGTQRGRSFLCPYLVVKLHPLDAVKNGAGGDVMTQKRTSPLCSGGDVMTQKRTSPLCSLRDTDFPLSDWYAAADAIVTDYSGVAVEAAAAGVASYYYIYDMDEYAAKRGLNVDLRDEATGKYAFADAKALAERLLSDFEGGDFANGEGYDYSALDAFAAKYLEVPPGGNTERLAGFIAAL